MQKAKINRLNRDRPGGHSSWDSPVYEKITGYREHHTGNGRAFCKRRVNKQRRRQAKRITAAAIAQYNEEHEAAVLEQKLREEFFEEWLKEEIRLYKELDEEFFVEKQLNEESYMDDYYMEYY
jgi:hypothetical protein